MTYFFLIFTESSVLDIFSECAKVAPALVASFLPSIASLQNHPKASIRRYFAEILGECLAQVPSIDDNVIQILIDLTSDKGITILSKI